jgi:hypothetical protein
MKRILSIPHRGITILDMGIVKSRVMKRVKKGATLMNNKKRKRNLLIFVFFEGNTRVKVVLPKEMSISNLPYRLQCHQPTVHRTKPVISIYLQPKNGMED